MGSGRIVQGFCTFGDVCYKQQKDAVEEWGLQRNDTTGKGLQMKGGTAESFTGEMGVT
jgi:hypothetical protein